MGRMPVTHRSLMELGGATSMFPGLSEPINEILLFGIACTRNYGSEIDFYTPLFFSFHTQSREYSHHKTEISDSPTYIASLDLPILLLGRRVPSLIPGPWAPAITPPINRRLWDRGVSSAIGDHRRACRARLLALQKLQQLLRRLQVL